MYVRNSPEGNGAEVWRKLLWEYELGVGIRYGAMLESLLKRRFGEHDETDLAREIESFERDISQYEQQSSDLISDAIKRGIVCGGMAHSGLEQHIDLSISRLAMYQTLRDENHQLQQSAQNVGRSKCNASRCSACERQSVTTSQR